MQNRRRFNLPLLTTSFKSFERARYRFNLQLLYRVYILIPDVRFFALAKANIKHLYQYTAMRAAQCGLEIKQKIKEKEKERPRSEVVVSDYDLPH